MNGAEEYTNQAALVSSGISAETLATLTAHPYADMFNMIDDAQRDGLRSSIKENGLYDKIVLIEHCGRWCILDGRNRYRELQSLEWHGDFAHYETWRELVARTGIKDDPFTFVVSKNLDRRQMDESQRALAAARVANMRQGERNDIKALPFDGQPSANVRKVSQGEAAKMFGVSERLVTSANAVVKMGDPELVRLVESGAVPVSIAEPLARLPADAQQRALAEKKPNQLKTVVKQYAREQRAQALAERQEALPLRKYAVIYCDNEWNWETRSENGLDRAPGYPVSSLEALQARRVQDIAADDCVLFMWATTPKLIEAFLVAHAWGFVAFVADPVTGHLGLDKSAARYVSEWVWLKDRIITGYWGRGRHEHLLIFTRGHPVAPAMGTQPNSVIECPAIDEPAAANAQAWKKGLHSAKPDLFAEWIEKLFPHAAKLEMNARQARAGWDRWGNEAPQPGDLVDDGQAEPWWPALSEGEQSDIMAARTESALARASGMSAPASSLLPEDRARMAAQLAASMPARVRSSPEEVRARIEARRGERGA